MALLTPGGLWLPVAERKERGSGTTAGKRLRDDHTLIIEVQVAVLGPILK